MDSVIKVKYTASEGKITLTNEGKDLVLSLGDISQFVFLAHNADFLTLLQNGDGEMDFPVLNYDNTVAAFLAAHGPSSIQKKEHIQKKERQVPADMRLALWKNYHEVDEYGKCYTCGCTLLPSQIWHAAHVVAVSKGGLTELSNLRTCCRTCNLGMRNQNMYAFICRKKLTGPGSLNVQKYFSKFPEYRNDRATRKNRDLLEILAQGKISV